MWKNSKVMGILRQPSPLRITKDQRQLENVEYFKYLGSMIINDARCTLKIKYRIAMAKAAFNKKKNLFTCKLDANLRKKLLSAIFGSQLSMVLKRRHFGK
jgi:hypothetical protein